jgi:REP element-mobilizing transposase RayT
MRDTPGARIWQRDFYEHVVRTEFELNKIRQYVLDNPTRWSEDEDSPDNL